LEQRRRAKRVSIEKLRAQGNRALERHEARTRRPAGRAYQIEIPELEGDGVDVLGRVHSISYTGTLSGDGPHLYEHTFEPEAAPILVSDSENGQLFIAGGSYTTSSRGIVDANPPGYPEGFEGEQIGMPRSNPIPTLWHNIAQKANAAMMGSRAYQRGHVPHLTNESSRPTLIKWLISVDPNGVWSDGDTRSEGWEPMTHQEAWEQVELMVEEEPEPNPQRKGGRNPYFKDEVKGLSDAELDRFIQEWRGIEYRAFQEGDAKRANTGGTAVAVGLLERKKRGGAKGAAPNPGPYSLQIIDALNDREIGWERNWSLGAFRHRAKDTAYLSRQDTPRYVLQLWGFAYDKSTGETSQWMKADNLGLDGKVRVFDKPDARRNPRLLPLAKESRKWNGAAARKRLKRWATNGNHVDWDKYAQGFMYRDPAHPDVGYGFKLPFADIVGGKLVAVPHAIEAIHAVLDGARGGVDIPRQDQSRARALVESYYRKMQKPFSGWGKRR
jgi:hypothetical protein